MKNTMNNKVTPLPNLHGKAWSIQPCLSKQSKKRNRSRLETEVWNCDIAKKMCKQKIKILQKGTQLFLLEIECTFQLFLGVTSCKEIYVNGM